MTNILRFQYRDSLIRWLATVAFLATPALACAQSAESSIDALRRALVGSATPSCAIDNARDMDGNPIRHCTVLLRTASATETLTVSTYVPNKSLLGWDHTVGDSASALAFLKTVNEFAAKHKLSTHDCGVSTSPAGPSHGTLWRSDKLVIYATHFTPEGKPQRVHITAMDAPEEFPMNLMCSAATTSRSGAAP